MPKINHPSHHSSPITCWDAARLRTQRETLGKRRQSEGTMISRTLFHAPAFSMSDSPIKSSPLLRIKSSFTVFINQVGRYDIGVFVLKIQLVITFNIPDSTDSHARFGHFELILSRAWRNTFRRVFTLIPSAIKKKVSMKFSVKSLFHCTNWSCRLCPLSGPVPNIFSEWNNEWREQWRPVLKPRWIDPRADLRILANLFTRGQSKASYCVCLLLFF